MARTETKTKLTLLVNDRIKRKARSISRRKHTSISKWFMELVERESKAAKDPFEKLDGIWKDREVDAREIRHRVWTRS